MRSAALLNEFLAAQQSLDSRERQALVAAGVPEKALRLGLIGAADVEIEGDLYQPSPGDSRRFIVPARVGDPATPEWPDPKLAVWLGDIVDLVAFDLEHPARSALRTGAAAWLGAIEPQYLDPPPIIVHAHPLAWLRRDCEGLVPLTRTPAELQYLLLSLRGIVVENAKLGIRLKEVLEKPHRIPPISVMEAA
jgi:hypothetical protein